MMNKQMDDSNSEFRLQKSYIIKGDVNNSTIQQGNNNNIYSQGNNNNIYSNVNPKKEESIPEAAEKIKSLLKQLERTNPSATISEQVNYINDKTNPGFKRRISSALEASGEAAIDEFILENKYLKVAKAAIKGWLQPDK